MNLISTRDDNPTLGVDFQHAMLNPNAPRNGLYTFSSLPRLSPKEIEGFRTMSYEALCLALFNKLGLNIDERALKNALQSYQSFDDPTNPAPLRTLQSRTFMLELFHGPTRAFKDMALQPFSRLFSHYAEQHKRHHLILTATSGDTGPATLQGFANAPYIRVACIYPSGGTSEVQRRQMCARDEANCKVFGIYGDFDDAQSTLKALLRDSEFIAQLEKRGIALSAANSVNIGRIIFQMVYYVWSYVRLLDSGAIERDEELSIIVPSGNFGNILGAFFAKQMGVRLGKLIVASNTNHILTDFIQSGVYDISHRRLIQTKAPAMDILKSSNVERLLYALYGSARTRELMESLESSGAYRLNERELELLQEHFEGYYCDDEACLDSIREGANEGVLLDPHTAIGYHIAKALRARGVQTPLLCVATAEWSKFAPSMKQALCPAQNLSCENPTLENLACENPKNLACENHTFASLERAQDDKAIIHAICESMPHIAQPTQILSLFDKKEIHTQVLNPNELKAHILRWLAES